MIATFKSEFRKLFTVRSTYIMIIFSLLITILLCFYFEGYKGNTGSPASLLAPTALKEIVSNGAGLGVLFASIIAILFMAHEYRYNMITYTLTANANRSKVLAVKLMTIALFGAVYGIISVLVAIGSYMLGVALRGAELPPQQFDLLIELGKVGYYYLGYALIGIIFAALTRSIVFAIAAIFVLTTIIEPLLGGLVLKENAKYLPITALDSTVGAALSPHVLSPVMGIVVSGLYLLGGAIITWILFLRRDAV